MYWITRKKTGKVIATDVPPGQEDLILANLPSGVYALETADGIELAVSVVRDGCVIKTTFHSTYASTVTDGAGI